MQEISSLQVFLEIPYAWYAIERAKENEDISGLLAIRSRAYAISPERRHPKRYCGPSPSPDWVTPSELTIKRSPGSIFNS